MQASSLKPLMIIFFNKTTLKIGQIWSLSWNVQSAVGLWVGMGRHEDLLVISVTICIKIVTKFWLVIFNRKIYSKSETGLIYSAKFVTLGKIWLSGLYSYKQNELLGFQGNALRLVQTSCKSAVISNWYSALHQKQKILQLPAATHSPAIVAATCVNESSLGSFRYLWRVTLGRSVSR